MIDPYRDDMRRLSIAYAMFYSVSIFLWAFGLTIAFAWRVEP